MTFAAFMLGFAAVSTATLIPKIVRSGHLLPLWAAIVLCLLYAGACVTTLP